MRVAKLLQIKNRKIIQKQLSYLRKHRKRIETGSFYTKGSGKTSAEDTENFSDNQTFFDVEKGKEYDKNSFIKTLTKEGYRPRWAEFLVADWDNDGEYELAVYIKTVRIIMTAEFLMRQIRKCMRMLLRPVQLRESVIWELSEVQAVQLIQTMTDCFWMEKNKNFMNIKGKGIFIGRICMEP